MAEPMTITAEPPGGVVFLDHGEDGPNPEMPKKPPPRLLDPQELAEAGPPEAVRIPLDLVDVNPFNPRRALAEVEDLAKSIAQFGLLQPVTVRRAGDKYELLGGHRRRAAFLLLRDQEPHEPKWRSIAAVVKTADDEDAYLMLLAGQLQTRAWRPQEEAAALERLAETRTLSAVGALIHRDDSWVGRRLKIYADSVLSGYVQAGGLLGNIATELLPVKDPAQRREYAERAVAEHWTQHKARGEVRKLRLDSLTREVGRRAREMADLLSSIDVTMLPVETRRDLEVIFGRLQVLAKGSKPVFPTVGEAEVRAGISQNPRSRPQEKRRRKIPPPS